MKRVEIRTRLKSYRRLMKDIGHIFHGVHGVADKEGLNNEPFYRDSNVRVKSKSNISNALLKIGDALLAK